LADLPESQLRPVIGFHQRNLACPVRTQPSQGTLKSKSQAISEFHGQIWAFVQAWEVIEQHHIIEECFDLPVIGATTPPSLDPRTKFSFVRYWTTEKQAPKLDDLGKDPA
jgi:hypothetical protein